MRLRLFERSHCSVLNAWLRLFFLKQSRDLISKKKLQHLTNESTWTYLCPHTFACKEENCFYKASTVKDKSTSSNLNKKISDFCIQNSFCCRPCERVSGSRRAAENPPCQDPHLWALLLPCCWSCSTAVVRAEWSWWCLAWQPRLPARSATWTGPCLLCSEGKRWKFLVCPKLYFTEVSWK